MDESKVWLVTGAGRGLGACIVRAALAAGHRVVASGRDPEAITGVLGATSGRLLGVRLDITSDAESRSAVAEVADSFGRLDVLVNNAGTFVAGYFEELLPEQIEQQLATGLLGPMNITRAALPVMRAQGSGHIVSVSSSAGLVGFEYWSSYNAAKFGLEGWMQALGREVEPLGIHTTIVNPGSFRTDFLAHAADAPTGSPVPDYADRRSRQVVSWRTKNGQQPGDPEKLAAAMVEICGMNPPPRRFVAGADAIGLAEGQAALLMQEVDALRDLSLSLGYVSA
ncbi:MULTISPECIES: SDR family oxidoreductase [unclassified Pseudofrankia]|uniref:SDR family oxidoreductase n=1 Tax=unclassified Pseudofrankia TaxID=2994372 RepID=UPI0008DA1EA8|nr:MULTISPECIES: SDR family oxidoreductase [unclassified Pseudofrankia]MDT3444675.1 SDR family oxidoreductase [Pseudofrankia sp. BMG5.37]OHV66600.1 short-chain dehydrogenase/reductase [Pseudofrankia sp. BMG5.36]